MRRDIYVFVCKKLQCIIEKRDSLDLSSAVTSFWASKCVTETSVPDELVNEKEKYKNIADEMDQAFSELSGF